MTVVEKIVQLCDRALVLRMECKTHRPEVAAELRQIQGKLGEIKASCPTSWAAAADLLYPKAEEGDDV